MMNTKRCKACHARFTLDKRHHYVAINKDGSTIFANALFYDAIDCPFCGSQNIIGQRLMIER